MRRAIRWTGTALGVVLLVLLALVGWVQLTWSVDHPATPFPTLAASDDSEVLVRGEYLVNAVAHCSTCHAPAEQVKALRFDFVRPLAGGNVWEMGPFGAFTAANLTPHPTGIGRMSDAEIARVVRTGIGRDGKLSPMMRFSVGPISDEDLVAILSWLRTQEPVEGERARPKYGFLAKALSRRFTPRLEAPPAHVPAGGISLERGAYLANGPANCIGCHTPLDPLAGFVPSGPAFSGAGQAEPDGTDPGYEIVAPNLTPHPTAGHVASWSEEAFVARFGAGRVIRGSVMPWEAYQRLTEDDVRSLYRYLRTLEPVERNLGPTRRPKGSFKG